MRDTDSDSDPNPTSKGAGALSFVRSRIRVFACSLALVRTQLALPRSLALPLATLVSSGNTNHHGRRTRPWHQHDAAGVDDQPRTLSIGSSRAEDDRSAAVNSPDVVCF